MGADDKVGIYMSVIWYRHVVQSKKLTWGRGCEKGVNLSVGLLKGQGQGTNAPKMIGWG